MPGGQHTYGMSACAATVHCLLPGKRLAFECFHIWRVRKRGAIDSAKRPRWISGLRLAALALLMAWGLVPGSTRAASREVLEACLAANVPERSSASKIELRSRHRDGFESTHEAQIIWRRSSEDIVETLICMEAPAKVRGVAYLISKDASKTTLWGYLPEKDRVFQIRGSAAARRARIARTAISYDDLRYFPINLHGAEPEVIRESMIGERKVSVVHLSTPSGEDSPYARIVSSIDHETCVPLRTEFYGAGDRLLKRFSVDPSQIREVGGVHIARSMAVEDVDNEVVTELRIGRFEANADLPDQLFVPNRLGHNRCRRPDAE